MGKLKEFDITFTNNKVVYSPGESISGSVKITTGTSLQYKGKITSFFVCITGSMKHIRVRFRWTN